MVPDRCASTQMYDDFPHVRISKSTNASCIPLAMLLSLDRTDIEGGETF